MRTIFRRFSINQLSVGGVFLAYFMAGAALYHASAVTIAYRAITKAIKFHNEVILKYKTIVQYLEPGHAKIRRNHSIATQCLTTFVRLYIFLYYPLGIALSVSALATSLGVIEPITIFTTVVVANSCGAANAVVYFYNERLKARRKALMREVKGHTPSNFSVSQNQL
jgi:hypothetical protein